MKNLIGILLITPNNELVLTRINTGTASSILNYIPGIPCINTNTTNPYNQSNDLINYLDELFKYSEQMPLFKHIHFILECVSKIEEYERVYLYTYTMPKICSMYTSNNVIVDTIPLCSFLNSLYKLNNFTTNLFYNTELVTKIKKTLPL